MRLAELQQAAVFAQFGDESQKAEQQPICPFLILLLLDLKDNTELRFLFLGFQTRGQWGVQMCRLTSS